MAHYSVSQQDMVVRLLEWCGKHIPLFDLDEDTIEAAGGDPIAYLECLAQREDKYRPDHCDEVEDGFEDFEDMPLDFNEDA